MTNIIEQAYLELYGIPLSYQSKLRYSGRFKGYNANISRKGNLLTVSMSREWKQISRDIKIGLIQELMVKLFKKKAHTMNIDLYNNFIKEVHIAVPKTKTNPALEESFNSVNERFFYGMIEKPNLAWKNATRTLGSYEFGTDTIAISQILKNDRELLDYVMYHEILHKKHKFRSKNGRHFHHTSEFRKKEKSFPNSELMEKRLLGVMRKSAIRRFFRL